MTEKRFVFHQNENYHTVIDTVEEVPIICLEFKENEFWDYACFHRIIDMLNGKYEENKQLKTRLDFCSSVNKETNKEIELMEEENEQLKKEKQELIDIIDEIDDGDYDIPIR